MINNIYDEQFDLSYYVKGMSYSDTENMAIFERKEMYNRLLKRKSEEKEANEEVSRKISQARAEAASSRASRTPKRIKR